jgi:hypothetical protein
MRTKTLLLSAVIGAAGMMSAMAQTVYSVNIVGYINLALPEGLSLIANQLNATPDNTLPTLFGAPQGINLTVSKYDPSISDFRRSILDEGAWSVPSMTLAPGEGAFLENAQGNGTLNVTLVGEVQLNSSVVFAEGLRIASSVIPQAGPITDMGLVPPGNFTLFKYEATPPATAKSLVPYIFEDGAWLRTPSLAIGESFFADNAVGSGTFSWNRTFTVGPP